MSDVTLYPRGQPERAQSVLRGDLVMGLRGNWSAHIDLADAPPEGRCTLRWLDIDLPGYVLRGGAYEGLASALVVGGEGQLGKQLQPRGYDHTVPVRTVLQGIVQDAGETLASTATPSGTRPAYARLAGTAGEQLDALLDGAWRVRADGTVWVGAETWSMAELRGTKIDEDPAGASVLIAPDTFCLLPGLTLDGRRIGAVRYWIDSTHARCRAWMVVDSGPSDPLKRGLFAIAREALRGTDYHALYPAKVVVQRSDGTLDVQPESDRVPPLTSVRPRVPCHGAKVTVPAGSRVLLGFDGGKPDAAYVALWEQGSGGKAVARVDDPVAAATSMQAWIAAVQAICTALAATAGAPAPVAPSDFGKITAGSPHLSLLPGLTP